MAADTFYIQMAITVATAGLGLIATHHFTSLRDRKSAERLRRLDALSKAYFAFVTSGIRKELVRRGEDGKILPTARDVEDAIAMLHLYGTPEQSEMASAYSKAVATTQNGNSTALVNSLRETVRSELGLGQLNNAPSYLSIEPIIAKKSQS
jgi:hypothetical protein